MINEKLQEYLKGLIGHQSPEWYENAANAICEICESNLLYSDAQIKKCVSSKAIQVVSESIINALNACGLLNHQIKPSIILEQAAKFRWYTDINTRLIWRYSNSKSIINIYYDGDDNTIARAYDKENDSTHIPISVFEAVSILTERGQNPLDMVEELSPKL